MRGQCPQRCGGRKPRPDGRGGRTDLVPTRMRPGEARTSDPSPADHESNKGFPERARHQGWLAR